MSGPQTPSPEAGTPTPSQPQGNESVTTDTSPPVGTTPSDDRYSQMTLEQAKAELQAANRERAASKQEVERRIQAEQGYLQRLQQYEAIVQQLATQAQYQQQTQAVPTASRVEPLPSSINIEDQVLTAEEAQQLHEATIAGDIPAIQRLAAVQAKHMREQQERIDAKQKERAQTDAAAYSLIQQSVQELQTNPALAQKVGQKYQQLAIDPVRGLLYKNVPVTPIRMGNQEVHPMLLRDAIQEAKAELGVGTQAVQEFARTTGTTFIEPSARGADSIPGASPAPKFDPAKHLFDWELDYCNRRNINPAKHWEFMDERVKEARLREGRPVKSATAIGGTIEFTPPVKR